MKFAIDDSDGEKVVIIGAKGGQLLHSHGKKLKVR